MAVVRFVALGDEKRALLAGDDSEAVCAVGSWENCNNTRRNQVADIVEEKENQTGKCRQGWRSFSEFEGILSWILSRAAASIIATCAASKPTSGKQGYVLDAQISVPSQR